MDKRQHSLVDSLIAEVDHVLRSTLAGTEARRPYPAAETAEAGLDSIDRRHSAGLMRVNHAGEVAAQALYQGQALTARLEDVKAAMEQAADEERDHLAWCEERLDELGSRTSLLNPLWYAGSFAIGALAGLAGDRWSLGFLAETEQQVVEHLEGHLGSLPQEDARSRAVVEAMRDDEAQHRDTARDSGAARLPRPVKKAMRVVAGIMTRTAYHL